MVQGRMEFGRARWEPEHPGGPARTWHERSRQQSGEKREGFRPFAPVVASEDAWQYFDIAPGDEILLRTCSMLRRTSRLPANLRRSPTWMDPPEYRPYLRNTTPGVEIVEGSKQVTGLPSFSYSFNVKASRSFDPAGGDQYV